MSEGHIQQVSLLSLVSSQCLQDTMLHILYIFSLIIINSYIILHMRKQYSNQLRSQSQQLITTFEFSIVLYQCSSDLILIFTLFHSFSFMLFLPSSQHIISTLCVSDTALGSLYTLHCPLNLQLLYTLVFCALYTVSHLIQPSTQFLKRKQLTLREVNKFKIIEVLNVVLGHKT